MDSSAIQLLSYASLMMGMIVIPLLASDLGANYLEIGVIVAAYGALVFVSSYIFGRASDIHGRKILLVLGLLASTAAFFLQIFADSVFSLIVIRALVGFCAGIYPPALIAYVYEQRKSLGTFSAYGSLGWAIGSFLTGIVASYNGVFVVGSLFFFTAFMLALRMPEREFKRVKIPLFPAKLLRENSAVYLPFLLRHIGAVAIWTVFPLYLMGLGADKFWIAVIYTTNSLTQVIVMRKLDRFDGSRLFRWGMVLSALAFLSFALAQNHYQMLPTQVILGFSWSFAYVGALLALTKKNIERATSVGILRSMVGLAGILGPLLAGPIAQLYGLQEVMYFAAALTLIGFLLNILLHKRCLNTR